MFNGTPNKCLVYALCAPADSGFAVSNLWFMISFFHLLRQLSWSHFAFWLYTDQWSEANELHASIAVSEFLYFHMLLIWLIILIGYNEHVQYEHILKNTIYYIVFLWPVVLDLWPNNFLWYLLQLNCQMRCLDLNLMLSQLIWPYGIDKCQLVPHSRITTDAAAHLGVVHLLSHEHFGHSTYLTCL